MTYYVSSGKLNPTHSLKYLWWYWDAENGFECSDADPVQAPSSGSNCVFVDSLRKQMKDAGFPQLLSDLCKHGDAAVGSLAATISLIDDVC